MPESQSTTPAIQTPELQARKDAINRFKLKRLLIPWALPLIVGLVYAAAGLLSEHSRDLFILAYLVLSVGFGIAVYIGWPQNKRPIARRLIILFLGALLLWVTIVSGRGNMQIEGLFFGLFTGISQPPVLHFAIAKILGPLLFGRIWCGWACWFGAVFDQLPYPASRFRQPVHWGRVRYIHFTLSLLMVAALVFGAGYRDGGVGIPASLYWFLAGYGMYLLAGVTLAFMLKDNRAFCKYICPISVPMKVGTRVSLLKVKGIAAKCDDCKVCVEMCPMNIRIPDYILKGERVLSTECTLCQTCINICPHDALKLSFGFDLGGKELIDEEPPRNQKQGLRGVFRRLGRA